MNDPHTNPLLIPYERERECYANVRGYVNENRSPLVGFVQMRRVPSFVGRIPNFGDVGLGLMRVRL